jgi:hypothetical protein
MMESITKNKDLLGGKHGMKMKQVGKNKCKHSVLILQVNELNPSYAAQPGSIL